MELTAELIIDSRSPKQPVLSPDGRSVAYLVSSWSRGAKELWVLDGEPRRLPIPEGAIEGPRWTSDSAWIVFRSDHDEPGTAQLYRIRPSGDSLEALVDQPDGVTGHWPLADPDRLAFTVSGPEADPVIRGQEPRNQLRLLDIRTGSVTTPALPDDRHVHDVAVRPDRAVLAVFSWSAPDIEPGMLEALLHVVDLDTGEVRELGPTAVSDEACPVWWQRADGWHVLHLGATPPGYQAGTAVFDLPESGGPAVNLTEGLDACPIQLAQVDEGAPLVVLETGLDTAVCRIGPDGLTEVYRHIGAVQRLTASRDGSVVAASLSTPTAQPELHTGPPAGPLTRRTDLCAELADVIWGTQERLCWTAEDGLELGGLLVLPPGKTRADGPFPLVTNLHGGPYGRYADELGLAWWVGGQWLAAAGFAVFMPNPRGSSGRGHEFATLVADAVGEDEFTDVLAGIDHLIDAGVADPDRLGITGWSHGGFLSAWAVTQSDRFVTAVIGAGVIDWGAIVGSGEYGRGESDLGGSTGWEGPGPHLHDAHSPISFAGQVRVPVLILHGAEDTNVPLAQAEYFHRALYAHGVEHEFVVYPREGHWILERAHQLDVLRRSRDWFVEHLNP